MAEVQRQCALRRRERKRRAEAALCFESINCVNRRAGDAAAWQASLNLLKNEACALRFVRFLHAQRAYLLNFNLQLSTFNFPNFRFRNSLVLHFRLTCGIYLQVYTDHA